MMQPSKDFPANEIFFPNRRTGESELAEDIKHTMEVVERCGEEIEQAARKYRHDDDYNTDQAMFDAAVSAIDTLDYIADRTGFKHRNDLIKHCLDRL